MFLHLPFQREKKIPIDLSSLNTMYKNKNVYLAI